MKGMYKMTEHEYAYRRALKDKEDYRTYWNMLLAGLSLSALFVAMIFILGAGIAIL